MYTRLLVPLDGSELAEQVLPPVRSLAKGLHARVDLLRVFSPVTPDLIDPAHGQYVDRVAEALRVQAQDYLDAVAAPLRREGIAVACEVHEGNAADLIVRAAEWEPGTLVAMATHGRSGIGRWVLGSITDKVLHATTKPLLVVRARQGAPPAGAPLRSVIVPLDGSPLAEQVLPHAAALAEALALRVVLARVSPTTEELYRASGFLGGMYQDIATQVEEEAQHYLREVGARLREQRGLSVEERLLRGHPAGAIVELAQETPGTLVAMTTHGRSGIGRWMLGSVTGRVVRHAPCPVLVVRATAAGARVE